MPEHACMHYRTGTWQDLQADARRVRDAVFVREQGFAPHDEYDAFDAVCVHAVACTAAGEPVGTARLLPSQLLQEAGCTLQIARIGRVAVAKPMRGSTVGTRIMQSLQALARQRGDTHVQLSAQTSAAGFYQRLGYRVLPGAPYDEAGIPHVDDMCLPLA